MKPLSDLSPEAARAVRYVLTDVDDTLTRRGKLTASTYAAIEALRDAGYIVVPITGGPAGWCDMMVRMWPVAAAIAESGAVGFYIEDGVLRSLEYPGAVRIAGSERIAEILAAIRVRFPLVRIGKNQFCRLFDLAIDYAEDEPRLPRSDALAIKELAKSMGACVGVSSIHVNIWLGPYDKMRGAEYFLSNRYGYDPVRDRNAVLYVGDSPNDEPMFERFPNAVGVANIAEHASTMQHLPTYIAKAAFGDGFCEIARSLMRLCEKK